MTNTDVSNFAYGVCKGGCLNTGAGVLLYLCLGEVFEGGSWHHWFLSLGSLSFKYGARTGPLQYHHYRDIRCSEDFSCIIT